MRRLLIFFVLISAITVAVFAYIKITKQSGSFSPNQPIKPLTQKEMLQDFEYMYNVLNENYPFFEVNKRINKINWPAKKNDYITRIKSSANDEAFLAALTDILKDLNNGHTHMVVSKRAYENHKLMEGEKGPWFNQLDDKKAIQRYLSMPERTNQSNMNNNRAKAPLNNVSTQIIEEGRTAYIKVNSFNHLKAEEDFKIISPFFNKIKDYSALIIDIRDNGGGTDSYWVDNIVSKITSEPVRYKRYYAFRGGSFVEKFIKFKLGIEYKDMKPISKLDKNIQEKAPPELKTNFRYFYEFTDTIVPKESIQFKGKVFLLVNKKVFSSAESFAIFSKSTKFATIVGERTGGDGIGVGPILCVLPNSGYIFRFSHVMGLTSAGVCNDEFKTEPDFKVDAGIAPDIKNDNCINYVLKLIN